MKLQSNDNKEDARSKICMDFFQYLQEKYFLAATFY